VEFLKLQTMKYTGKQFGDVKTFTHDCIIYQKLQSDLFKLINLYSLHKIDYHI